LSLQDVKEKLIPAGLQIKGGDGIGFEEQTYAIIYEVAKISDPRTKDINGVPIYCAYVTDSSSEPAQLTSVKAIYPTRQGFFQLLNLIRSQELLDEFYNNDENWHENDPYLPEELIKKIFQLDVFSKMTHGKRNYFKGCDQLVTDRTYVNSADSSIYRSQKRIFQILSPIRIAMIGGLHRTAAACHLFSGITPTPNSSLPLPKINKKSNAVNITKNMVINATTALTILVPKTPSYNDNYINQTAAYSYRVDKRKTINLLPTFKSLSLMILDREKNKDITDEMKFSKHTIFTKHGSTVSSVQSFSPLWFFHNF